MNIAERWPQLDSVTRAWLIAHNGDAIPAHILSLIAAAGGDVDSDAPWVGSTGPDGFYLSDEAIDWVEAVANGESPDGR